ncbi:MAG TPA: LysR family transcriptional regulator [Polyangiaceae bacterium]|nr:LysR family transcriptional regulator [Polyangiaceae bacterium]
MHLDDIVAFITVADEASFSAAAKKLGATRVATTRAVANLERVLGTRLLNRTTRRVSLSSAGRALREQIGDSIASLSDALQQFSPEGQELAGSLRVGVTSDVVGPCLGSSFARYADQHPQVQLELTQASDWTSMTSAALDVVVACSPEVQGLGLKAFKASYVGAAPCGIFAAPSYLETRTIPESLADLAGHTLVACPPIDQAQASRPELQIAASKYRVRCGDLSLARDLVRFGCGLGVLPRAVAEPDVARGELVPLLRDSYELELHLWLLSAQSPYLSPVAWSFGEFLKADLKQQGLVRS